MNSIDYEQLIDYHNNNDKRKLQDLFPFNSTVAGLNDVYVASDDGKSFYINTPCIVASNKTIIKDITYLLLDLETDDHQIEEFNVKVLDAFFTDGSVYILIQDLLIDKKRIISQFLDSHTHYCPWFMIDVNYLHSTPISAKNHGNILVEEQELLEFDF